MKIGKKIKTYRERINLSQEELADKVYVSRQTISNWENDKSYPDINSLNKISDIFDVSLDNLIKGDMEKMEKLWEQVNLKEFNMLSNLFAIGFLVMLISAYPLLKFLGVLGIIILILIGTITLYLGFKLEKIYKKNDFRSYKEISAFLKRQPLSTTERIEEKAKRPYQKFLLAVASGIITFLVFIMFNRILG